MVWIRERERPDPANNRVTNPEQFLPLPSAVQQIIEQLDNDFEVDGAEGCGLDEEFERGMNPVRPVVNLIPADPEAAPIVEAFTSSPCLQIRFGTWYKEPIPSCGCDAYDESAEGAVERLNDMLDGVAAGRFREAIEIPGVSFMGSAWVETKFWSFDQSGSRMRSRVGRSRALEISGGLRPVKLIWKGWHRRRSPHGTKSGRHN